MRARTTAAWIAALEAADVPCGPINTLDQVYADPHVIARGAVETAKRRDGTTMQLAVNLVRMSATPPSTRRAPPPLGQDTEQTLRELLGLDERELSELRNAGAI